MVTALSDPVWDEQFQALAGADREADASQFISRLPAGYRDLTTVAEAIEDLALVTVLEAAAAGGGPSEAGPPGSPEHPLLGELHRLVVRPALGEDSTFRLRRFGPDVMELSTALPLIESFGLVVVEAAPMRLAGREGEQSGLHIDDIAVRVEAPNGPETLRFVPRIHGRRLVDAIEASAAGDADVDPLNRLVTTAGLDWRQVMVLRAYLRYWRQSGVALAGDEITDPLAAHPDVVRALVAYFEARFDPTADAEAPAEPSPGALRPSPPTSGDSRTAARNMCLAQLDLVTSLDDDRVLRTVLALIDATVRTNFFLPEADGARPGTARRPLVLKFESGLVPDLPAPRPRMETFVHGSTCEGVHLRAGLIARGGLRWSERPGDFRTEVLDLAFAQVKKNAIIVPTGAKGGFVYRAAGAASGRGAGKSRPTFDQVRDAYRLFVTGLLEITDNIVGGRVVTPPGVVAADGPDPYLVVAADKGTATFSDLANSISEGAGYWLGDAFASGGSRGYDHKAMGITARGAWVAVRRHFRELGMDVATDPVRVVGVGDMSGDVFGNGMLQSRAIRLVAAFDHRHVFLDPDPDPELSYRERARLATLERSSWADYRTEVISPGGGVWSRDTKTIPLSPAARRALGVNDEVLSPPQVVSAILRAPVDLLWFGGIGTFVKAAGEPDSDVADHANDQVRVTSDQVRARVIAEGANLGVTQRARIRYSRRGGRINADFIDNAAGVATSDREVNLKILLALAIEQGRLDPADRDGYLSRAEDEVATEVLRQVDHSVAALNRATLSSERDLDAYEALVDDLEAAGRFDRTVEVLPDAEEFRVRRAAGAGLIRPELATILAYAKSEIVAVLERSPLVSDAVFLDAVVPYFPAGIRADFPDLIAQHRLYPQLVATDVAGELVDQLGIVWPHDLAAELGRPLDEVAAAFWVARRVVGAGELWAELEQAASSGPDPLPAPAESALHGAVADAVAHLARHYLTAPGPLDPGRLAHRDLELLAAAGPLPIPASKEELALFAGLDLEESMVEHYLSARRRAAAAEAGTVAVATGRPVADCLEAMHRLDGVAGLAGLAGSIGRALDGNPPPDRLRVWQARAVLDDMAAWRRRAARAALAEGGPPEAAVSHWAASAGDALRRAAVLDASRDGSADPLAVATLTLRRLARALPEP